MNTTETDARTQDTTTQQTPETPRPEASPRASFITPEMIAKNPILGAAGLFAGDPLWQEVREEIKRYRELQRLEEEQAVYYRDP